MSDKTSRIILILVLALSSAGLAVAQASKQNSDAKTPAKRTNPQSERQKSAKEGPEKFWLDRAEWLTLEIREEEWRVREQRPLLLARLAEAWWKYDTRRAKNWMESAIGELEFQPQNESPADLRNRIENAEAILKFVQPLDRSYADRLLKVVAAGIEQFADNASSKEDKRDLSRLSLNLSEIAGEAMRSANPDSADRLFRTLLKLKDGNTLQSLFFNIRNNDVAHADKLYAEALNSAAADYDPSLLFGLGQLAYPSFERAPWMLLPEELRLRFLDVFSAAISRVPQSQEEQASVCRLWREGARLSQYFPKNGHDAGGGG